MLGAMSPLDALSTVTNAGSVAVADRHPIGQLSGFVTELLPDVKLPFQRPPARRPCDIHMTR
jgi:hypothetical protein